MFVFARLNIYFKCKSVSDDFFSFFFLYISHFHQRGWLDKILYIRSQKNKPQLLYRGYTYNKKTTYQNGNAAWRCADMNKFKCLASCIVNGTKLIRSRLEHNHPSRNLKMNKKVVFLSDEILDNLLSDCPDKNEKHLLKHEW